MANLLHKIAFLKRVASKMDHLDKTIDRSNQDFARYYALKQQLTQSILHSTESGIAANGLPDTGIVISLTTHGTRIHTVCLAIESVFQQTYKPDRVVLYLGDEEFSHQPLPIALQRQMERGLEIRYVEDIGPHTKLIPALREFPEASVITIDDDCLYPFNMIERLVRLHEAYPGTVCCSQSLIMAKDGSGELMPYKSFKTCSPGKDLLSDSLLAEGYGGILYPPHVMPEEVFDVNLLKKLSPHADDIWFKAMELLAGIPVVQMARNSQWFHTLTIVWEEQGNGLLHYNVEDDGNDIQFKNVFDHFDLYGKLP